MQISRKARYFWPLVLVLFLTDCTTKDLVLDRLSAEPGGLPVIDGVVRFVLAHNDGLAYGIDVHRYLGSATRPLLIGAMTLLTIALLSLYRSANARSRVAGIALGLAVGGAIGNLYDRVRFPAGVVDFIDVGIGVHRFWVFNVADAGITIGGIMLAVMLLHEDQQRARSRPAVQRALHQRALACTAFDAGTDHEITSFAADIAQQGGAVTGPVPSQEEVAALRAVVASITVDDSAR